LKQSLCIFTLSIAALLLLTSIPGWAQGTPSGNLRAGASMVDITPKPSDLRFPTDSIRDHLFARVIVVDDGKTCAVLAGLDLGVSQNDMIALAVPKIMAATGCPAESILISATHTHSPNTSGFGAGPQTAEFVADALEKAAKEAKAKLAPATVGYGRTNLDLNVNRDLYNSKLEWRQAPNLDGPSDKTLSVVEFIGADYVPIGIYVNYAMHPIDFYLSGVVSADFPGEASRALEAMFDNHTVAIFSQGTSGDQNPKLMEPFLSAYLSGGTLGPQTIGKPEPPIIPTAPGHDFNPMTAQNFQKPVPEENLAAYHKDIERTSATVTMMGTAIAENTLFLMRNTINPVNNARIWGGQEEFTCPGRDRMDTDNPIRENGLPPYKDGADVHLKVGLLRIGDINFTWVDGEVYTDIGLRLKAASPANKLIIVTLANGMANSGYIYSDDASYHLSFQVIGSRLKPGCAEGKIVGAALDLMHKSGE
jgi:hypothetical protein